jgi:hypothetical protein
MIMAIMSSIIISLTLIYFSFHVKVAADPPLPQSPTTGAFGGQNG